MATKQAMLMQIYASFNARDIDAILPALHPQVRWPNGWEGGYVDGPSAIRDYWTRQWAEIDPEVVPESFVALLDGRIRVLVRQCVRDLAGHVLSEALVSHTYAFEAEQVISMEIDAAQP